MGKVVFSQTKTLHIVLCFIITLCLLLGAYSPALADDGAAETITDESATDFVSDDSTDSADSAADMARASAGDTLPDSLTVMMYNAEKKLNENTKVIPVSLSLNGASLQSDVPAMAVSGRTLVPVRLVSEQLKAKVVWEKSDNTVTVTLGEKTIILTIGSNVALINGEATPVPDDVSVSLVTYDGAARTMVPLRFVSETLGADVNYDQMTRNADIIPPVEEASTPDDSNDDENNSANQVTDANTTVIEPARQVGTDENGKLIRRVVIDAGHGGKDPGTSGGGHYEKTVTLAVAIKTQALLEAAGYEVIMSRTDDTYPELLDRAALTTENDAPVFVSIHCNSAEKSPNASGIETYAAPDDAKDSEFAKYIQNALIAATGAKDRGVKTSRLIVLTHNEAPACLTEIGFMTNTEECAKLWDESYQQKIAQGIVNGIEAYFAAYNS